jgi:heptosyltransferase-2
VNLFLLERIGLRTELTRTPIDLSSSALRFASELLPADGSVYVAISPTCGHSELKQWGVDRFAKVTKSLSLKGAKIVLVGGPSDIVLGEQIEAEASGPIINLIGKTSLLQMAAVLTRCAVFFGNDAGPMHVASLMGTQTIAVFGSSCHHRFGPWAPLSSVLVHPVSCSPCLHHLKDRCETCIHEKTLCMQQIPFNSAIKAISPLLPNGKLPVM